MDKKLLEALSARAEQKREAKTQAKKFYVGGTALDFVQPSLDTKLSYAEALTAENPADTVARAQASFTTAVRRCRTASCTRRSASPTLTTRFGR